MYVGIVMKVEQSMSRPRQSKQVPLNPCGPLDNNSGRFGRASAREHESEADEDRAKTFNNGDKHVYSSSFAYGK